MALVTKSTCEQGQISIFFSASLVVLVSIVAFVINVGLFVKAKINLQNATDAAAFAGAAVQARQLSKIAYLNWEMRNIYKEWMYKYYVVGNLNIEDVKNSAPGDTGTMAFNMLEDRNPITNHIEPDRYNIPSICIHLEGSKTNICRRYAVPGLPEFGSANLPGAEEASRSFMNRLIGTKVDDCINRTQVNMSVALAWAYNIIPRPGDEGSTIVSRGPAIMSDRQGAWPRAIELAIRMRNLEYEVNTPARTASVCVDPGAPQNVTCDQPIEDVTAEEKLGNERTVKAFWSGFRNIGGSWEQDEMKNSFTLTEIAPQENPVEQNANSASYYLVPGSKVMQVKKQYLDLRLMMVNLATFYSAMIPRADTQQSGACDVAKVAIPIPGYPLGFYKNPEVLTYYAVKGEAEYYGMFNPFSGGPIKLTAYAAAKPFGGRIGPMLFFYDKDSQVIRGRKDSEKRRSVPYIAGFDVVGTPVRPPQPHLPSEPLVLGAYGPGVPLPVNGPGEAFWLDSDEKPVGGRVADANGVQFGIPNLAYDYGPGQYLSDEGYNRQGTIINTIRSAPNTTVEPIGLYNKTQFSLFKGNLDQSVSPEELDQEIARIRAATMYEAANYLIPTPFEFNTSTNISGSQTVMDSFGFISGRGENLDNGVRRYTNYVYAPLFQNKSLFSELSEVHSTITEFMRLQESGMDKYKIALNQGARSIWDMSSRVSSAALESKEKYETAAKGVADINFTVQDNDQTPASCNSLSGQFLYFFWSGIDNGRAPADGPTCPTPMAQLLQEYFSGSQNDPNFKPDYYRFDYSWYPPNFDGHSAFPSDSHGIFSAYVPGPFTGVNMTGEFFSPIPGSNIQEVMRRNFYSTKLINLGSLMNNSYDESKDIPVYSEGGRPTAVGDVKQPNGMRNPLQPIDNLQAIKH